LNSNRVNLRKTVVPFVGLSERGDYENRLNAGKNGLK